MTDWSRFEPKPPTMSSRRLDKNVSTVTLPRRTPQERPGPVGGRRDTHRRERTSAIARAALDLFLERGLEAVSIDDIARAAGVAKGSFYTYFHDKGDVVDALVEPVRTQLRAVMARCEQNLLASHTRDALVSTYRQLALECSFTVLGNIEIARLYLQECRGPAVGARRPVTELADEIHEHAVKLSHAASSHGLLRAMEPRVTAAAVVGAAEHLLYKTLRGADLGPPEAVPDVLISLVVDGIRAQG